MVFLLKGMALTMRELLSILDNKSKGDYMFSHKPILCVDFDGVIHSYKSPWINARTITDPPVFGAISFLIRSLEEFNVAIYSSRSKYIGGRNAMKKWLMNWFSHEAIREEDSIIIDFINQFAFADPWQDEVNFASKKFINYLHFPLFKPAAFITIDDRAICFKGIFPDLLELKKFKPWNKL